MRRIVKVIYYDDAKDVLGREAEYAKRRELLSKGDMSDDDMLDALSGAAKELNLNVYGEDPRHKDPLDVKSDDYPDHDFSVGVFYLDDEGAGLDYFLKSYGLNGVWDTVRGVPSSCHDLQTPGGIAFQPDWPLAAARLRETADQLESLLDAKELDQEESARKKYMGLFAYKHLVPPAKDPITEPLQALRLAAVEKIRIRKNHVNDYGVFFSDTYRKLHAVVNGESGGEPAVFLIYYGDMTWYLQGMRVIADTFDYVSKGRQKLMKAWLVVEEDHSA